MTKRSILKFLGLMGVMAVAACDTTQMTEPVAPQASELVTFSWAPVPSASATESVTKVAVIGSAGGTIYNGANTLIVPSNAVLEPTEFTFTMVGDGYMHASLTARSVSTGLEVTAFPRAVMLRLSYANAVVSNPYALSIAWLVDGTIDGPAVQQTSFVTTYTKVVTAYLYHFSDYSIGLEN